MPAERGIRCLASLKAVPFLLPIFRRNMKSLDFEAQSTLSYALSNGILDLDRVQSNRERVQFV